ncbi:hypothetical protein FM107_08010 [Sphingobacterium sp. JB170]|nr:hypothetical protein FM107_08010 [Sphingobacterium sp. JB170]
MDIHLYLYKKTGQYLPGYKVNDYILIESNSIVIYICIVL